MNTLIFVCIPNYKYSYTCIHSCVINMKLLNSKDFIKIYNLKNDSLNESQLQSVFIYPIYPRDSKIYSDKGFVNIDNGSMGGSHWTCFIIKQHQWLPPILKLSIFINPLSEYIFESLGYIG